ncbi:MAG TPA: UdgX family uracil-DNA binding protein [Devosiaceae bacterium]|jgi:DNA polymerase
MHRVTLRSRNDFAEWRTMARALLLAGLTPDSVRFIDPDLPGDLFAEADLPLHPVTGRAVGTVPERFIALGKDAICHRDSDRFGLLYRLLWRLQKDKHILELRSDPDVAALDRRVSAVRRDAHKMTAFVRFRRIAGPSGQERFAAWFEPEHFVLEPTAPFFVRRFTAMNWAIVTPYASALWDGEALSFGPGGNKADVPAEDALEDTWRTYYASIFNPARLKVAMMKSEMPMKYWRNLPEAELIPSLIAGAKQAEDAMIAKQASIPPVRHARIAARQEIEPAPTDIKSLAEARAAVQECRRCPLYEMATQAVFGAGPVHAELMFVGEQPGDQEDLQGKPFVGPAGKVFDTALEKIGIDRTRVYVTNAVKHFKFEPRGKKRIHQRPNSGEIAACRFWVNLERDFVKPKVVVALGATAAQSLLGHSVTISRSRGQPIALEDGSTLFVTIHPSFLLRMVDRSAVEAERAQFEADLAQVRDFLAEHGGEDVKKAVH